LSLSENTSLARSDFYSPTGPPNGSTRNEGVGGEVVACSLPARSRLSVKPARSRAVDAVRFDSTVLPTGTY